MQTFQTVVAHHAFLHVHMVELASGIGMFVRRSTALDKSDDWYKPVDVLLDSHQHELLWSEIVTDETMMFGEAEHTMYKLGVT